MAIDMQIKYADVEDLYLDPRNPRLGRRNTDRELSQEQILDLMKDWSLEELAVSFLESGFWPQEALLAVHEPIDGATRLVVVEGNRRLAALLHLQKARSGQLDSKRWKDLVDGVPEAKFEALRRIPYLLATKREEIETYLGFRHVTGIKQWNPTEKAEYIAHLIDDRNMTYVEVMRKIGSKTPTVRQNYITYRLLLQMENAEDRIDIEKVEDKFSVLYLSLRSNGVRTFLQVDIEAEPGKAKKPVPQDKLDNLVDFARWLFGSEKQEPVVTDSRLIDKFGKILETPDAIEYLKRSESPSFETAYRRTGGEEIDVRLLVDRAADSIEEALTSAHRHRDSTQLSRSVHRLGEDALQLIRVFPDVDAQLLASKG